MSDVKHLILTDETGQLILEAIQALSRKLEVGGRTILPDDSGTYVITNANALVPGVVKVSSALGIGINSSGALFIQEPDNSEIFARSSPTKSLTLSKLDYATKVVLCDVSKPWEQAEKLAAQKKLGLDDYVLPLKVNADGNMTVQEAYNLSDGVYYFVKPLYNASADGHSIHGMCSVSEHFINNYDYGIYFGDYSTSSQKFTTVGSIDGYGQIEQG